MTVYKLTVVVNGVHTSVLLNEVEVFTLDLAVNIKCTDSILTLAMNQVLVDDQHQLHVVPWAKLLVVAVPFANRHRLLLRVTHLRLYLIERKTSELGSDSQVCLLQLVCIFKEVLAIKVSMLSLRYPNVLHLPQELRPFPRLNLRWKLRNTSIGLRLPWGKGIGSFIVVLLRKNFD